MLFELSKSAREVKISVILGPGPHAIRNRLFEVIQNSDLRTTGPLPRKHKWLKTLALIKLTEVDAVQVEDRREQMLLDLENFFREVVPKLSTALGTLKSNPPQP
jgi:hypothetical protein